jgi:hypothetical protein
MLTRRSRDVLDLPFVLLARDARDAAAELQRRWGFSSITASWPSRDAVHGCAFISRGVGCAPMS